MKRLQVMIEEDLDDALERAARQERTTKSELVRRLVRERVAGLPPIEDEPLMRVAGADDFEPAPIDEVALKRIGGILVYTGEAVDNLQRAVEAHGQLEGKDRITGP